ncbi:sugar ABC transporter permease [Paenibacillus selenitireducens]|uniref:Sugar ABC transporter permease n=1 Tax=Paenibacillus selenitireducens TaxID=1324314 RepID=A0A1T2XCY4_9BACL|nr:sugar ABC transporter permease [Paenibacillus selenitireducens]OPA77741.1 sugar ABC transporter permease [Paenibacillus selenitireducens]
MQMETQIKPKQRMKRSRINRLKYGEYLWGYLFIAPFFLGIAVFYIWPVLQTFYFSFTEWGAFNKYSWSGIDNYTKLASDKSLMHAFQNTLQFVICSVPLTIIFSIIAATLLNQKVRGLTLYRTLYFLPVVTMPAAVSIVWKWLYNGDYGLINYVLSFFHIKGPTWLSSADFVMYAIIIVAVWMSIGNNMIILLSGLQGISSSYYEAAEIDGARPLYKFIHITIPLLTPTIFFVTVMQLISAFQMFDLIFMMIGDKSMVIQSAQTVVFLFYKYAFIDNAKGYASTIAIVLLVIIMVVTAIQMKLQKKWVHYE